MIHFNSQEKIKLRLQYCVDFLNEFSCHFFALFERFLEGKINGRFLCASFTFYLKNATQRYCLSAI